MFSSKEMDIKRFFKSPTLSDVTIKFSDREIKAHKLALCGQSSWFKKACEGHFKEASLPIIELEEDDPAAVEAMLRHCYGLDAIPAKEDEDAHELLAKTISVYATADKYDIPALRGVMLHQFTELFGENWRELWDKDQFQDIMERVIDNTVATNDPLRDAAVTILDCCTPHFIERENKFVTMLESLPELSAKLFVRAIRKQAEFKVKLRDEIIPTITSESAPHALAKDGNITGWLYLLRIGYDVDILDHNDETPLHWSAWAGRLEMTRLLVNFNANVRASSRVYGRTPLEWARERQEEGIEGVTDYAGVIALLEAAESRR